MKARRHEKRRRGQTEKGKATNIEGKETPLKTIGQKKKRNGCYLKEEKGKAEKREGRNTHERKRCRRNERSKVELSNGTEYKERGI